MAIQRNERRQASHNENASLRETRERSLAEGKESPQLRLKTGGLVNGRQAYAEWQFLEALHRKRPAYLYALLAVAQGNGASVPPSVREQVRRGYPEWFEPGGELKSLIEQVLLSSFRDTADGPMLVNPFQLDTSAECETFQTIERQCEEVLRDLLRGEEDPPKRSR